MYLHVKENRKYIPIMPPDLALRLIFIGSNYPCLELIFMVPKVFEPLKVLLYNTEMTDTASESVGKERRRKMPLVTGDVLDLNDGRRDSNKRRYEAEGAEEYKEAKKRLQRAVKKAKEDWIVLSARRSKLT